MPAPKQECRAGRIGLVPGSTILYYYSVPAPNQARGCDIWDSLRLRLPLLESAVCLCDALECNETEDSHTYDGPSSLEFSPYTLLQQAWGLPSGHSLCLLDNSISHYFFSPDANVIVELGTCGYWEWLKTILKNSFSTTWFIPPLELIISLLNNATKLLGTENTICTWQSALSDSLR